MLGRYDNFPEKIHRIATFTFSTPARKIQEKLVQALHEMNTNTVTPSEVDQHALRECAIVLETGIAESRSFSFLDETEVSRLQESLKKEPFRVIDFFFAARYYKIKEEKKTPLRFDYFLVRAAFLESILEMRIFHERGPRYISPEDVGNLVVERVNRASGRRVFRSS